MPARRARVRGRLLCRGARAAEPAVRSGGRHERPSRPRPRLAVVEHVEALTPHLTRIVFGGEGLEGFARGEFTDHYVKLQLPPQGAPLAVRLEEIERERPREQWPLMRTYTVRASDASASR